MTADFQQLTLFPVEQHQTPLPDYQVRESGRARHVSLKISFQGALEVVVPRGFDPREIPDILERRRDWIAKTLKRIEGQRQALPPEHLEERPTQLALRSRNEIWHVHYAPGSTAITLAQAAPHTLTLSGAYDAAPDLGQELLRGWLQRKARSEFAPWLRELSQRCGLSFSRVSVRGQTSRWGSCSSRQSISLNYKLLFLPPPLVEYVLIHELCHTVHMNHSPAFWELVALHCPTYDRVRADLKQAWKFVPGWVDGR
ncbi:MAG: M48 family metallopeptidase [Leptolyngbyaceae cyanobacterium T60_A2020_046]|nr:M48 family metallopeptidase [Leptolyngbyaceae cyanobacterium T60_A2020_046]